MCRPWMLVWMVETCAVCQVFYFDMQHAKRYECGQDMFLDFIYLIRLYGARVSKVDTYAYFHYCGLETYDSVSLIEGVGASNSDIW